MYILLVYIETVLVFFLRRDKYLSPKEIAKEIGAISERPILKKSKKKKMQIAYIEIYWNCKATALQLLFLLKHVKCTYLPVKISYL